MTPYEDEGFLKSVSQTALQKEEGEKEEDGDDSKSVASTVSTFSQLLSAVKTTSTFH
jgi:hypothetical protein